MSKPPFTILMITAERQVRRVLQTALVRAAYHLEEAETREDGLLKAVLHRPDLVMLDLDRPQLDGLELLKALRQWADVPLIVLSDCQREEAKILALDAGADDYVTKPL